jgi:D-ribose pyranose/furanose isomerase RbsD
MEQMVERLLAEIKINQARTDTNIKEMKADQEEMLAKIEANIEKVEVGNNMWTSQEEMKASQKEIKSKICALSRWPSHKPGQRSFRKK